MKKFAIAFGLLALPVTLFAQSAISAYQLTGNDLRGTARFMSMGGAFTALGGDLSSLNQNPAGIGVYRSSDVGLSLDLNLASSTVDDGIYNGTWKEKNTFFYCNNFGYIGASSTGSSVMPFFQWGASYSRIASFDRTYAGSYASLGTSMSNYIANFSNGYNPDDLGESSYYDPYWDSSADWLSILGFNSYIINPVGNTSQYNGLFQYGSPTTKPTTGNAEFMVRERGHIDEYSINFGGNFIDKIYWGLGFGITEIDFKQDAFYDEELQNARIASASGMGNRTEIGDAYYSLGNWKHVNGAGFNVKFGLIFKPINELRLGVAIHSPTWYNLTERYNGDIYYNYTSKVGEGTAYSDDAYFDWKLRSPWRLTAGVATVLGGRFIASVDYEMAAYDQMNVGDNYGPFNFVNNDIKAYYQTCNTIRAGLEFRLTPSFSARVGFAQSFSGVKSDVLDGYEYVSTSGTNPAYTFNRDTRYITAGLGYRYKWFYADLAYVNKHLSSTYQPFSSFDDGTDWIYAPYSDFTTTENNIVLTLGVRF